MLSQSSKHPKIWDVCITLVEIRAAIVVLQQDCRHLEASSSMDTLGWSDAALVRQHGEALGKAGPRDQMRLRDFQKPVLSTISRTSVWT